MLHNDGPCFIILKPKSPLLMPTVKILLLNPKEHHQQPVFKQTWFRQEHFADEYLASSYNSAEDFSHDAH